MSLKDKVKEVFESRIAEGLAASVTVIVIWAAYKITPVIMPAIESVLSVQIIFPLLLASFALNIIFLILFWVLTKRPEFKLKYGIYWDSEKNPHCPNCKIPIGGYAEYDAGKGYYCKPCKKIFPLTDANGNNIDPQQVINEL